VARQLLNTAPEAAEPVARFARAGHTTREDSMKGFARILLAATLALAGGAVDAQDAGMKKWTKGKGWDGSGDLRTRLAALKLVTQERPTTLACLLYDRYSYKWPGHSRGEIIASARPRGASRHPRAATDHGVAQQRDLHKRQCRDADRRGLGHITHDPKNEFYNGFTSDEWGGDFGLRKADVTTIPPIVARGVLLDIAGLKNVEALPSAYEITVEDVDGALRAQNVNVTPGAVVLLRTGTQQPCCPGSSFGHDWICARPAARLLWNTAQHGARPPIQVQQSLACHFIESPKDADQHGLAIGFGFNWRLVDDCAVRPLDDNLERVLFAGC